MMDHPGSVRAISSGEFELWQPSLKVIAHEHARRFAAISLEGIRQQVALSWRSEGVEPVIAPGNQSELWLGVDQRVACVARDGRLVVSIGLGSALLDIKCFRDLVAVLCETEVLLFNADYSIREIHGLRDIPTEIAGGDGKLIVTLDDGTQESIG